MKNAKLILVGAGPGDSDLITLKGIKALQQADVVLYDTLSNPELLTHAPPHAEKIYVGKKAGSAQNPQEKTNELIVSKALENKRVVRLKGGDPFIFGRGHEELAYAQSYGIPVEVVPGISSCSALGALQHIPLTKRGINESFWATTGVTRNGEISDDIALAAQTSATIAVLMGMRNLSKIAAVFERYGKQKTPVAIIQKGSLPEEKMVLGTIDTIVEKATQAHLHSPALILIGEVVQLHPAYATNNRILRANTGQ